MDPAGFCGQTRVIIVAGKGGAGKTTVSAVLARMAAGVGLTTLVIDVEGTSALPAAFGRGGPLSYDEVVLAPAEPGGGAEVRARTLTPDDALVEYLEDHGMGRISRRLLSTGAVDVVATAAPGIKDILVLGKVKQLERAGSADLLIVDAPATGHAVSFLSSASGLLDAVRVGPIRAQAEDVVELLGDPARCQVLLVTLPEETPVNEAVESAYTLEDRVGVSLAPVVVNGLYPHMEGLHVDPAEAAARAEAFLRPGEAEALAGAVRFRTARIALQAEQVERLGKALPLPQLALPFLFTTEIGLAEIDVLAGALAEGVRGLPA
ncbi:MAG TPA: ArsA-related P-loop ATPase [Acidimicrobiales bacterium]|nr:ArsA-related P-loop ATPase [Acidimicrobiales bacterium]